jgi:hypothetical protein
MRLQLLIDEEATMPDAVRVTLNFLVRRDGTERPGFLARGECP